MTLVDRYRNSPPVITMADPTRYGSHAAQLLGEAGFVDLAHALLIRVVTLEEAAQYLTTLRREGSLSIEGQYVEIKLWDWVALEE